MADILRESERRLRWGIPLRLDQTVALLSEGIDAAALEEELFYRENENG